MSTKEDENNNKNTDLFYYENGFMVMTATYLKQKGYCCGNGCRHCPFKPKHQIGNRVLDKEI